MVDRVYRNDLPSLRRTLLEMRAQFSKTDSATDWVRLRIDPLLRHLEQLERLVPSIESSRLRGGVPMLHSDLVYFRENVKELRLVLRPEKSRAPKPLKPR
jgi:hypothetical protein